MPAKSTILSSELQDLIKNKLKIIQRRLPILLNLYPNYSLNNQLLAMKCGVDDGNFKELREELENNGLVNCYYEKASRNDRVIISLSDLSFEIITSFIKSEKITIHPKVLGNNEYLSKIIQVIKDTNGDRKDGARELLDYTENYLIPLESDFFTIYESKLINEEDQEVLSDLLKALNTAMTHQEFLERTRKSNLIEILSTIAMEKGKTHNRTSTKVAIDILCKLLEGENRYNLLLKIYEALINKESQSSREAIDKLIINLSGNREKVRMKLLEIYSTAPPGGKELIKGHKLLF